MFTFTVYFSKSCDLAVICQPFQWGDDITPNAEGGTLATVCSLPGEFWNSTRKYSSCLEESGGYCTGESVLQGSLSYRGVCLTGESVLQKTLSYKIIFFTGESVLQESVLQESLSYRRVCLTDDSVLLKSLSYRRVCLSYRLCWNCVNLHSLYLFLVIREHRKKTGTRCFLIFYITSVQWVILHPTPWRVG